MDVQIVKGGIFHDERGSISFVNDFDFSQVKRFYIIENSGVDIIRAWQGHQYERKWFYVVSGSYLLAWVKVDDWNNPDLNLKAETIILNEDESQILSIPKGYANGLKALENNSKIIVFSDMSVEQSIEEKIRYPKHYWLDWDNIKKQ